MSEKIEEACLKVARIVMWDNKPVDAKPIIDFQKKIVHESIELLEIYSELGATEQDLTDAIHFIAQVYAIPPIGSNPIWFSVVLSTILEIAFPNSEVSDEAANFAETMVQNIQEQILSSCN